MTLFHTDWLTKPPIFTEDSFQQFINNEINRLRIPNNLQEQYIKQLFSIPLNPSNIRAFSKGCYETVYQEIHRYEEMENLTTSKGDELADLYRLLELAKSVGVYSACISTEK